MQHIGILAHSADGAALCYLEMVRESARRLGEHQHPEITLSILPMGPTIPLWDAGDLSQIIVIVEDVSERKRSELERARFVRELQEGIRARDDFL